MPYPAIEMNVDAAEIEKFSALAQRWWDPNQAFKTLHDINPIRLAFIKQYTDIEHCRIVDIGCGGGILAEALAAEGAEVTGIDLAEASLQAARLHLRESGRKIDYQLKTAETLASEVPEGFDIVSCMEMLEHVPAPASVIRACAQLVKPGGWVFFSTLSRTLKSYLLAIVGAEYLLNLLPRGTHEYGRFIKPSELSRMARVVGLEPVGLTGMRYNPFTREASFHHEASVNYLIGCRKF